MSETGKTTTTSVLWEQLIKAPSIEQFFCLNAGELGLPPFSEFISSLCKMRGEVPERVIKRAGIERSFGHSIFRGDRKPSRDTVLQLAFGFGADIELSQSLLRHAGCSLLYPKVPRDVAISYCLLHGKDFLKAQDVLMELGLPLIGGTVK